MRLLASILFFCLSSLALAQQPYRIGPLDTVKISVFQQEDLEFEGPLDSDGKVKMGLISAPIPLSGKTAREAERAIEKLYIDQKMLKKPQVSVTVLKAGRTYSLTVLGAVKRPGTVPFSKGKSTMDLFDVISECGGFSGAANQKRIEIQRNGKTLKVNFFELQKENRRFTVYPLDRINVKKRVF